MTPYDDIDLGQHYFRPWLVAWRHLFDLTSAKSCGVHLRAISQEILEILDMCLKITNIRLQLHPKVSVIKTSQMACIPLQKQYHWCQYRIRLWLSVTAHRSTPVLTRLWHSLQHIERWTKPTFCKWYFQTHFFRRKSGFHPSFAEWFYYGPCHK